MKTMTCKQLFGACDKKFQAETFEKMAELSKHHGMEMFQKGDEEHLEAINKMGELMQEPEEMRKLMEAKQKEFDELPDN